MIDILLFLAMSLFVLWLQNGMRKRKKAVSEPVLIPSESEKREPSFPTRPASIPKKEGFRSTPSSPVCQKGGKRFSSSLGTNWKSKKGLQKAFILSEILKRSEEDFR